MNREERAAVRTTPPMVDAKGERCVGLRAPPLDDGTLAKDAAIRGHAVDLELEDAAVFEDQLEDFAILRNGR
jgi:hypothetical protein